MNLDKDKKKWWLTTPAIIIGLILFFPIGIYQTFKSDWSRKNKTIAIGITLLMALIGLGTEDTPTTVNNSPEVKEDSLLIEEPTDKVSQSSISFWQEYKEINKPINLEDTLINGYRDMGKDGVSRNEAVCSLNKFLLGDGPDNSMPLNHSNALLEISSLCKSYNIYSGHLEFETAQEQNNKELKKVEEPFTTNFEVTKVSDGDTITVLDKTTNKTSKVRLACIDAPETSQPYGKEAEYALNKLLGNNPQVNLNTIDTDRYDRLVSEVFIDGVNLNQALVEAGVAVIYPDYFNCDDKTGYINSQKIAKNNNKNIWSDPDFIMPWDWRKGVKANQEVSKPSTPTYTQPSSKGSFISGTCKSLKSRGLGPFYQGDANYTSKRDRDNDGVACE